MSNPLFVAASLILIASASVGAVVHLAKAEDTMNTNAQTATQTHPYVGMWVTEDGRIRHELLPNNRYDEARGTRESAYQGRYEVTGTHIEYWDDTGFTADGDFVSNDVLHHGGMVFYRRKP
ncbi:hypothetical protein J2T09_000918 [Neorhizobium huautlense]|uniref:Ligand-binding protein with streptavidin-like fold n=1 Tax=Neorhizobium huautlense TaxID=67774 RepID=A0ABT9PNX5_9HYPH|nr:Atu4866 domain-containing protein [Neorhizobium huautlense]MDP9836176.1 hypothetical protein [Neorhizobium huautlense]